MKLSLIFTLAAAAVSVAAVPATGLTAHTHKRVCCKNLGVASDPVIEHLMEEYGIGGAANDDILGFGCRKLRKGGTCSSSTKLGYCDLDSYVKPHIYTSCETL